MSELIRLDKLLSDAGFGTRSEVKAMVKKKRVSINFEIARDCGAKVDPGRDTVQVDGNDVQYSKFLYFMLNKPAGVVSATNDGLSETVIELLDGVPTKNLFPVGRLDKDTEGLLMITNDGQLAHELLSPKKHVDKIYHATVDKALTEEDMLRFRKGLDIGDDKPTLPAEIRMLEGKEEDESCDTFYEVVIREGRYHQIKRMFEVLGSEVLYLKRMSMGSLKLDPNLLPGEFRELSDDEIHKLKNR